MNPNEAIARMGPGLFWWVGVERRHFLNKQQTRSTVLEKSTEYLKVAIFKPETAGEEAQMLPLCHAVPLENFKKGFDQALFQQEPVYLLKVLFLNERGASHYLLFVCRHL